MNKIIKFFKKPKVCIIYILSYFKIFRLLPDKLFLKLKFKLMMNKKLNFDNVQTYNEKLQWLKLYDRKPEYTKLVDKYGVREYIAETIGSEYLIPLLGVWDSFEDIDFSKLPNKFVLKYTHDSGSVFVCKDKSKIDYEQLKKDSKKWLKRNYYWVHREWPYKNVKPRIVCEQFISDNDQTPDDYKVLCFNGKAKLIEVHMDRFANHKQDIYDIDWNKTDITQGYDEDSSYSIKEKPKEFDRMIELSEKLAQNKAHVRIDWFVVNDKLYFGEITFYDGSGYAPFDKEEHDYLIGSWINLD